MQTILCFGDSNTHGADPGGGPRFDLHTRWPGVLRDTLGDGFWVVEEGLGGRTTVHPDPVEGLHKCGRDYLLPCLESHRPIDLVIIMLGTNDLKQRFSVPAEDIAKGAGVLVDLVKQTNAGPGDLAPRILLIAPPPITTLPEHFEQMFAGGIDKSRQFARYFKAVADLANCDFLDAGEVIVSSERDGIHFEKEEHAKLGKAVAQRVREILQGA